MVFLGMKSMPLYKNVTLISLLKIANPIFWMLFEKVGENLHEMTKTAFNEHWIDYPTYEGKQPGAFCENLGWIHESRIITNYNNTLSDIITVAHELGHAFHGEMIEEQAILNRDYCMPLAENGKYI